MTIGDDLEIDAAAGKLDLSADRLATIGGDGYDSLVACEFDSSKATRLVFDATNRRTTCLELAGRLKDAARDLRNHAEWMREKRERVRGLERRIRDWAATNPSGSSPVGADATLIGRFPATDSLEWEDLAGRLSAQGITF